VKLPTTQPDYPGRSQELSLLKLLMAERESEQSVFKNRNYIGMLHGGAKELFRTCGIKS